MTKKNIFFLKNMSKTNEQVEVFVCGERFLMSKNEFSCFKFLDTMVKDILPNEKISFDSINPEMFGILLEYVKNKYKPPKQNWKPHYFKKYQLMLGTMLQCSQFLDIPDLQEDIKNELVKYINTCNTVTEMNKKFNIDYNITKEKSQQVYDKLKWAELE